MWPTLTDTSHLALVKLLAANSVSKSVAHSHLAPCGHSATVANLHFLPGAVCPVSCQDTDVTDHGASGNLRRRMRLQSFETGRISQYVSRTPRCATIGPSRGMQASSPKPPPTDFSFAS